MSLPKPDPHTRIHPAAHQRLQVLSRSSGEAMSAIAERILNRALLGEGYESILAAEEMVRMGMAGSNRE